MSELKPCPFCGRQPEIAKRTDALNGYFCVIACFCGGYSARAYQAATSDTKQGAYEKAKQRWNRRYQEPNEPLTLEQLREMDGEPVWLETGEILIDEQIIGSWEIVERSTRWPSEGVWFSGRVKVFLADNYGKTWIAYRRKPESEEV